MFTLKIIKLVFMLFYFLMSDESHAFNHCYYLYDICLRVQLFLSMRIHESSDYDVINIFNIKQKIIVKIYPIPFKKMALDPVGTVRVHAMATVIEVYLLYLHIEGSASA